VFEVRVLHPVGEALLANTNALKYTIAGQLMHDKASLHDTYMME